MKKVILSFLAGGIICATVTGFAVEYAVTANPYPVKVNGQTVQVEGYNINDSTYFKLRDIADAVGGFEVGFEDNAIIVNTPSQPTATPAPTPLSNIIKPTLDPNKKYMPYEEYFEYNREDGLPVYNFDGRYYVNTVDICVKTDFDTHKFDDNYMLNFNNYVRFVLVDYYDNTVLANPDSFKND